MTLPCRKAGGAEVGGAPTRSAAANLITAAAVFFLPSVTSCSYAVVFGFACALRTANSFAQACRCLTRAQMAA